MALSQSVEQSSGVSATYWRIVRVDVDIVGRAAWVLVGGYLSHEARLAEKDRVVDRSYTMALGEGQEQEDVTRTVLYTWLKTQGDFTGAEDA